MTVGWQERMTRLIASQVRRRRNQLGISTAELSKRTGSLGLEISRSTLANLESGRRDIITVPELLVLAAALDVVPVELAWPLGQEDAVEALPGQFLPTATAVEWFTGEIAPKKAGLLADQDDPGLTTTAGLFRAHSRAMRSWTEAHTAGRHAEARLAEAAARSYQALMRERGLRSPEGAADGHQ